MKITITEISIEDITQILLTLAKKKSYILTNPSGINENELRKAIIEELVIIKE